MSEKLPSKYRKLIGKKISSNFREAVIIEEVPMRKLSADEIIIKNRFVGINAVDVLMTGGGGPPEFDPKPPYPVGIEGIGVVVATGVNCSSMLHKPVAYTNMGAYSEYYFTDSQSCFPLPDLDSKYLPLIVSGLTAAVALEQTGRVKPSDTVLVTAAAGGTGQLAVQYAKSLGCHVIGTCSTKEKAEFLKNIGCDRPVIYTNEDLNSVLQKEYPKGVDVIYETIGGKMFQTAVNNIALHGRLVVIGMIDQMHHHDAKPDEKSVSFMAGLPMWLLSKSASINGFQILHHALKFGEYFTKLVNLYRKGAIRVEIDCGKNSEKGPFIGLESIPDAVDYLYSKKSIGKVFVELNKD